MSDKVLVDSFELTELHRKMDALTRKIQKITTDYIELKKDRRKQLIGDEIRKYIGKSHAWWNRADNKYKLKLDGRDILFKDNPKQRHYQAYKSDLDQWNKRNTPK